MTSTDHDAGLDDAGLDVDAAAEPLRRALARHLADHGLLADSRWRRAVETVPRHRFVPGFYASTGRRDEQGLPVWEPVTEQIDRERWLASAYTDTTLITQFDAEEPDWDDPAPRAGGGPTSSSTLPSLVLRMWLDADLEEGHKVLEIGTGTGYSTALACERLGDYGEITSIEVDDRRLHQAANALYGIGYAVNLAVADGLYGYWPHAPYDRIVAACSLRAVPVSWLAQTRPGGKILATLSGWVYGSARVLLTTAVDGTAEGPLLPGTISFMAARAQERPAPGNPADWDALTRSAPGRPARYAPGRLDEATDEAFFGRFLAQLAAPNTQQLTSPDGDTMHLIDITTGSAATLTSGGDGYTVRQAGPLRLWDAVETAWDTWDRAGRPGPETFRMHVQPGRQSITHVGSNDLDFLLPVTEPAPTRTSYH
ncbi:ATP-grasp peptide maturase system methyltransferase [Actinomadura syzygii]|uniref:Protein-L-isoaspartate O-methyltransferase n=1 Tax=Actinomadura syzygii TaxID=1427538 RepID=A0A5D0TTJ9_9ACTN|nr:ATP-grasp peptide maturase system methyltransferase [Actinomadura syzygii]TYC08686.1 SAM-dependent methyltransferase [Actinomadura syzygii]